MFTSSRDTNSIHLALRQRLIREALSVSSPLGGHNYYHQSPLAVLQQIPPSNGNVASMLLATMGTEAQVMGAAGIQASLLRERLLASQVHKRLAVLSERPYADLSVLSNAAYPTQALAANNHYEIPTFPLDYQQGSHLASLLEAHQEEGQNMSSFLSLLQNSHLESAVLPTPRGTFNVESTPAPTAPDPFKIMTALGSKRRTKNEPYLDVSQFPVSLGLEQQTTRGGVTEPFTQKLYRMIEDVEAQGKASIVSFHPHGRSFAIHDTKAFLEEILPTYFKKQTKMVSFVRQLNLYGFNRIHSGPEAGGYYHELFLNGRPELYAFMRRVGAPSGDGDNRRKSNDRFVRRLQPDFSALGSVHQG